MHLFDPREPDSARFRRPASARGRTDLLEPIHDAVNGVVHRPRPTGDDARLVLDPEMIAALAEALQLNPSFDEVDPSEPDTSTFLYTLICRGVGIRANPYRGPDRRLRARIRGRMVLRLNAYHAGVCADAIRQTSGCLRVSEREALAAVAARLDAATSLRLA